MSKKIYTPSHVANFILKAAEDENRDITQFKLLKLVFLLYGWVRAVLDIRLFNEEFEAWKFSPVIPSLYHEFKRFGYYPITSKSVVIDSDDGSLTIPYIDNNQVITVMQKCWNVYKIFTANALVNKTHEPDSPWAKHYTNNDIITDLYFLWLT